MMESTPDAENTRGSVEWRLTERLKGLRAQRGLTLNELARRSGVSRAMISLVERGESSPTASVLDRLAASLGVSLASLFAEDERTDAAPVLRHADQVSWTDPATGYTRRNLSPPAFPSAIELVEVLLPAGCHVAYDTAARFSSIDQQVWVLAGSVEVTVGEHVHRLASGDCLAMQLGHPTAFRNHGHDPARYLVALGADALQTATATPGKRNAR